MALFDFKCQSCVHLFHREECSGSGSGVLGKGVERQSSLCSIIRYQITNYSYPFTCPPTLDFLLPSTEVGRETLGVWVYRYLVPLVDLLTPMLLTAKGVPSVSVVMENIDDALTIKGKLAVLISHYHDCIHSY